MKNLLKFRDLDIKDIKSVMKIYNFHINNGLGNFEEVPMKYKTFYSFCKNILKENLPFVVCLKNEKIIAFSFLSKFKNKSGYRYSFEHSVYVDNENIGMGIGSKLIRKLIQSSKKNNKIKTIVAVIEGNSKASIKIHKKNGFKIIGTLKKIGFKKHKWLNSVYMQKIL